MPEGPTIGQLAEHLVLRPHSAVGLADRLAQRGLLERVRSDVDRRQVRLRLTRRGAEASAGFRRPPRRNCGSPAPH